MTVYRMCRYVLLCGASIGCIQTAHAQTNEPQVAEQADRVEVSDIVVTAQRRAERLQDVPITIVNVSSDTMRQASVSQLQDIAKVTTGVRFDSRYSLFTPTIRGISTTNYLPGNASNVALYIDGFNSPALTSSNFQLMNVESIQVLKGPQGTLFGRNATGGAVQVNTAKPSHDTQVIAEAGYGSYNAQRFQAYATTGLSDTIAVDIAGLYTKGDSWVTNIFTGDDKVGRYRNFNLRVGVYYEPSDTFSLLFRYEHAYRNDPSGSLLNAYVLDGRPACVACARPGAITATKRGEVAADEPLGFTAKSDAYQLTATLDAGFATVTSYSQYRTDDSNQFWSLDMTNVGVASLQQIETNKVFTQELILNSKPGGRLQWTAGAYYSNWNSRWPSVGRPPAGVVAPTLPYPTFLQEGIKSQSVAVFGDATYEVADSLFLTAGLRYTRDSLKDAYSNFLAVGPKFPPTLNTSRLTPRGVIRYEINPRSSVYASVSKGYKAAIYNLSSTTTPDTPILPESIWAYEIGYKYADRALSLNLSGYYYDYTNQQLAQQLIINNVVQTVITNAAASRIYGIDADIRYQFGDHFSVNAGASWNHARYTDFPGAEAFNETTFASLNIDASGFHMGRAPDYTLNGGAAYTADLGGGKLVLSGNGYYSSKFYFTVSEQVPQKAYATLDLRAEWTDPTERYTLAVAGKNVTGTHYLNQASFNALGVRTTWGAPATVEGSVRVKF